ncbi:glycoside hydrolase family 16 protein [Cryptosporangium minutisporangium]|uniref:GH16 domain-containing protein n=1 Tax=Cryptosporangium minutisporangium TaxID=113569 RepID=A0ABP6T847_9ACTN
MEGPRGAQKLGVLGRRRPWLRATTAAAISLVLAATTAGTTRASAASPGAVPAPPSGFTLTWSDDFNGAARSGASTANWRYDIGPATMFSTGEIAAVTNSTQNVYHDGSGRLVIRALRSGRNPLSGWTSGRIQTQSATFGARPGGVLRVEASLQLPNVTASNGLGYWPAFWMLGSRLRTGTPWPTSGEIDIMEAVNGRESTFGTLHCGLPVGGPCREPNGISSGERICAGCRTGFHTYAVEIDRSTSPEQIRWYLDGNNFFTVRSTAVDSTTWANAVHHPFFIILNLAIGGGFPSAFGAGPTRATMSGAHMQVEYVAVYNKG